MNSIMALGRYKKEKNFFFNIFLSYSIFRLWLKEFLDLWFTFSAKSFWESVNYFLNILKLNF